MSLRDFLTVNTHSTVVLLQFLAVCSTPIERESDFDVNLNEFELENRFRSPLNAEPEFVFKTYLNMNPEDVETDEIDNNLIPETRTEAAQKYKIAREEPPHEEDGNSSSVVIFHENMRDRTPPVDKLINDVRILCWVMTTPAHHKTRAKNIKDTWGKRCNKLLFMSTAVDASLPSVKLHVKEGLPWAKTKAAFRYVYDHHRHNFDWYLKVDDDTYVIVENLRHMLSEYHRREPIYFGYRLKTDDNQGYMHGGAGYVLSHEALYLFVNYALPSPEICNHTDAGPEDVNMAICLEGVGVKPMDSRDPANRERFLPFMHDKHIFPDRSSWVYRHAVYPIGKGFQCCSNKAVTFHRVHPEDMYMLDYLLYHIRPYGKWTSLAITRALKDYRS